MQNFCQVMFPIFVIHHLSLRSFLYEFESTFCANLRKSFFSASFLSDTFFVRTDDVNYFFAVKLVQELNKWLSNGFSKKARFFKVFLNFFEFHCTDLSYDCSFWRYFNNPISVFKKLHITIIQIVWFVFYIFFFWKSSKRKFFLLYSLDWWIECLDLYELIN